MIRTSTPRYIHNISAAAIKKIPQRGGACLAFWLEQAYIDRNVRIAKSIWDYTLKNRGDFEKENTVNYYKQEVNKIICPWMFMDFYLLCTNVNDRYSSKTKAESTELAKWIWKNCMKNNEGTRNITLGILHDKTIRDILFEKYENELKDIKKIAQCQRADRERCENASIMLRLVSRNIPSRRSLLITKKTLDFFWQELSQRDKAKQLFGPQKDFYLLDATQQLWSIQYIWGKLDDNYKIAALTNNKITLAWIKTVLKQDKSIRYYSYKTADPESLLKIKWFFKLIEQNINSNCRAHCLLRKLTVGHRDSFLYFLTREVEASHELRALTFNLYYEICVKIDKIYPEHRPGMKEWYEKNRQELIDTECDMLRSYDSIRDESFESDQFNKNATIIRQLLKRVDLNTLLKIEFLEKQVLSLKKLKFKKHLLRTYCSVVAKKIKLENVDNINNNLIAFLERVLCLDHEMFDFIFQCAIREDNESYLHEVMIAKIAMPLYVFGGFSLNTSPDNTIKQKLFHYYLSASTYLVLCDTEEKQPAHRYLFEKLCSIPLTVLQQYAGYKDPTEKDPREQAGIVKNLLRWSLYHGQLGQLKNIIPACCTQINTNDDDNVVQKKLEKYIGQNISAREKKTNRRSPGDQFC